MSAVETAPAVVEQPVVPATTEATETPAPVTPAKSAKRHPLADLLNFKPKKSASAPKEDKVNEKATPIVAATQPEEPATVDVGAPATEADTRTPAVVGEEAATVETPAKEKKETLLEKIKHAFDKSTKKTAAAPAEETPATVAATETSAVAEATPVAESAPAPAEPVAAEAAAPVTETAPAETPAAEKAPSPKVSRRLSARIGTLLSPKKKEAKAAATPTEKATPAATTVEETPVEAPVASSSVPTVEEPIAAESKPVEAVAEPVKEAETISAAVESTPVPADPIAEPVKTEEATPAPAVVA